MIGIRREDKNLWERRAPLTPDHVQELVEHQGLAFCVERSERRVFSDRDYRRAGAELVADLSAATVILAVKEIPVDRFQRGKVYLCFSHTTKGQAYNMPALRRLLELGCTLLDYEHVHDERGRRLVYFGRHAGYAGMIDCLWALGRRYAAEGHVTPFEPIRLAHEYSGLDEALNHLGRIGERLRRAGLPEPLRPIVVGFTGSGNVTHGALEVFKRLPTQELTPHELQSVASDPDLPRNVLYMVRFERRDRFERIRGGGWDPQDLLLHPERFRSALPRWLPHLTVLVNGAYWEPAQPRLLGAEDVRGLWGAGRPRLRVIADISCDIGGAIEITVEATNPGNPVYVWEVGDGSVRHGVEGNGPVVLAVDNLPCQLPVEASGHFGDALARFVPALARCDWRAKLDALDLPEELRRAIVVHHGRLTPRFSYLEPLVRAS